MHIYMYRLKSEIKKDKHTQANSPLKANVNTWPNKKNKKL